MGGAWVSDEAWDSLDHDAARLDRRQRRRVLAGYALVLLAVLGLVVGRASGATTPKLRLDGSEASGDPVTHTVTARLDVENDGVVDDRITAVTTATPGIRVVASTGPVTVGAHSSAAVRVRYAIANCPRPPLDVPVRLHVARGPVTVAVTVDPHVAQAVADACGP